MKKLLRLLKDEEGIAVIECGLIAAMIAIIMMTILTSIGSKICSR
jgi:Flp pilus assembly pilin Flp